MRVLVCGSREIDHAQASRLIAKRLGELPMTATIVHGGARGVDKLAELTALARAMHVEIYPADWERNGKRAGILRNIAMLDSGPDLVIAFWNGSSTGTLHTITEARKRGIEVEVIPLEPV